MPQHRILMDNLYFNFIITTYRVIRTPSTVVTTEDICNTTTSRELTLGVKVTKGFPSMLQLMGDDIKSQVLAKLDSVYPLVSSHSLTDDATICTQSRKVSDSVIENFIQAELRSLADEYKIIADDIINGDEIGKQYHYPKDVTPSGRG